MGRFLGEDRKLQCPACGPSLIELRDRLGVRYRCPRCAGEFCAFAVLRRIYRPSAVRRGLEGLHRAAPFGGRSCARCRHRMRAATVDGPNASLEIDACFRCQFVWLDAGESQQLKPAGETQAETQAEPTVSPKLELVNPETVLRTDNYIRRVQREAEFGEQPDRGWKYGAAVFGLPVFKKSPFLAGLPFTTLLVTVLMLLGTLSNIFDDGHTARALGFDAGAPLRAWGLTWVLSFFVHVDLVHFASNAYLLLIVGLRLEAATPLRRYIALLAFGDVFGNILGWLAYGGLIVAPVSVGASAGISSLVVYFACVFPEARVGMLFSSTLFRHYFQWIWLPVYAWVAAWILLQLVMLYLGRAGGVDVVGHLGGVGIGLSAGLIERRRVRLRTGRAG